MLAWRRPAQGHHRLRADTTNSSTPSGLWSLAVPRHPVSCPALWSCSTCLIHGLAHGLLYSSLNELSLVRSQSSTSSEDHLCTKTEAEDISYATVDHEDVILSAHYGYIYALTFANLGEHTYLISGCTSIEARYFANG